MVPTATFPLTLDGVDKVADIWMKPAEWTSGQL
jgi:hypothetical protein